MTCVRGKASPNRHTQLQLFADSGGYCQNPTCNIALFESVDEDNIHIAEIAHIFSASDHGPRSDENLIEEERGSYENLILLCPNCHTKIDKAENSFPDSLIKSWKSNHSKKIAYLFKVQEYSDRKTAREAIIPLLLENKVIFENYGPETDEWYNPESLMPKKWRKKILTNIIPNNRKLLNIISKNYHLLTTDERNVVAIFKQHLEDLEAKHLLNIPESGLQYPAEFSNIYD